MFWENKEGTGETEMRSSSQARTASQWPSRAKSPDLSEHLLAECFFICKMGTTSTSWRGETEVLRGGVIVLGSLIKGPRQD